MTSPPIIEAVNLTKRFAVPDGAGGNTLRGRLLHPLQRPSVREFQALQDVSFSVDRGEFFGIVGRNGSGKSTLLKVLAGIYHANAGDLRVGGTIAPFIELGVGFNPDLSGRENLYLNGVLLGLTRKELRRRYDEIVDFAELHDFMELKLRNFSSGMQVRLAFSIALQSGADILLIDEVLAVGDERFQRKCFETFEERKRSGQTVIFVTHDMGAVTRFCDRAMLLDHGSIQTQGSPRSVSLRYFDLNFGDPSGQAPRLTEADIDHIRPEAPDVELLSTHGETDVVDETSPADDVRYLPGEQVETFEHGATAAIVIKVRANAVVDDPGVAMLVTDDRGNVVLALDNRGASAPVDGRPGRETTMRFRFVNYLAEGWYWVRVRTQNWDGGEVFDRDDEAFRFRVAAPHSSGGIVDLPNTVSVDAPDAD